MKNILILILFLSSLSPSAHADLFGGGATDYFGNGITSQVSGSQRPWDVGINVSGTVVDPRTRTWNLSASDVPACTQSGTWNVGLSAGSNLVGKVGIDQTTPGTTNGVQVNAALPIGTNSIGQVTANAGTNLNTSLLSTSSNQTTIGSQTTKINDGTNTSAVKAASTAPVATDPALVVALSPNGAQATSALQTTGNTTLSTISTTQTSGSQKTQVVDGSGNVYSTTNGSTSGSITGAGQSVTLALPEGTSSTALQLTGTFVGTVAFESSLDAGTTYNARVYRGTGILNMLSTGATTFPSEWRGNSGAMTHVRVKCTAYTSGTLTVAIGSSRGPGAVFLNAAIPIGGQSVGNTSVVSLTTGTSFTGTYEDMSNVASIAISALTSQATTLQVQYSQDASTLLTGATVSYAIAANTALVITIPPNGAQYFRAVLSNASGSTSTVALETLYRAVGMDLTRLGLGDTANLSDSTLAPVNRAIIAGRSGANSYVDLKVDPTGILTIQGPSGAAGTPSGGILTIQGVSGGTKIPSTTSVGNSGTPTQTSVSCATSNTTLLAASTATNFISIRNPTSATATVWVNIAGSAAVAAAPSVDLAPGSEADFYASENSYLPTAQLNCISGGGSASTLILLYK